MASENDPGGVSRRDFVTVAGGAALGALVAGQTSVGAQTAKRRYAIVGTGVRSIDVEVEGAAEGGGRNRARFFFGSGLRPAPVVGYVVRAGTAGVSLVGWLPLAAWESFREAIAAGGPLEVHYETRDHVQGGYLRRLGLGRRNAPLVAAAPRPARSGAARGAARNRAPTSCAHRRSGSGSAPAPAAAGRTSARCPP